MYEEWKTYLKQNFKTIYEAFKYVLNFGISDKLINWDSF